MARSADKLGAIAAELGERHAVRVHVLAQDMTASGSIEAVMTFAEVADVVVNNAGSIPGGTL